MDEPAHVSVPPKSNFPNNNSEASFENSPKNSSWDLYFKAVPLMMESNSRIKARVETLRSKRRKAYYEKLKVFIDRQEKRGFLSPSLCAAFNSSLSSNTPAHEQFLAHEANTRKKELSKLLMKSVSLRRRATGIKAVIDKAPITQELKQQSADTKGSSFKKTVRIKKIKSTSGTKSAEDVTGAKKPKKTAKRTKATAEASSAEGESLEKSFKNEDELGGADFSHKLKGLPEEEARRILWRHLSHRQIPKLARLVHQSSSARQFNAKKIAQAAANLIKRQVNRFASSRPQVVARRSMREMLMFWKRNEREERDLRKRAEKEAAEKRRAEEEEREARRQAKKLNFLITQTELYSHFVGRKQQQEQPTTSTAAAKLSKNIDFADVDDETIKAEAERIAKNAVAAHQAKISQFDSQQPATTTATAANTAQSMDFMNPTTLQDATILEQPSLMQATLKSYQLKGLTWLASLYEQGINGILADEMGLGKTIQSISLLAHLAERQNNWGPFLIVTPASTLHNWQQEFTRFVPALKVIPYWGNVQDRKVLRSTCMPFWTGKRPVTRDTAFHVMITSYQLIISDEAYLQKVKWQFMILDEAQAIKSSTSIRWKTLLSFNCRNRLLLTGTPIQNSMQELWALLHFIMPTLFDSHDEFSEWFSKDIESHAAAEATTRSSGSSLNIRQLQRLHMILKPFMLRRVKKDVENEMGEKVEIDVFCDLSPRQRRLYRALKEKLPIFDLLTQNIRPSAVTGLITSMAGASLSMSSSAIDSALMNLVMQFRKVCNHPELLERTEITSPLSFAASEQIFSGSLSLQSRLRPNPPAIEYRLPRKIVEASETLKGGKKRIFLEIRDDLNAAISLERNFLKQLRLSSFQEEDLGNSSVITIDKAGETLERLCITPMIKVVTPPIESNILTIPLTDIDFSPNSSAAPSFELLPDLHRAISIPSMEKFIRDCGKMRRLDSLLRGLKEGGHRVLIYNQMTRMIDLLEEYLQYRGYSYLRLDGSTNIATRRDLVNSWQQADSPFFIFLLSTRAGGLGINLTAADTVIFYDSDWNPTVDQQAMDRAHRLGQTKQVTVYRLITRNSVEERIMQRAKEKDEIHKVVISGGSFGSEAAEDQEQKGTENGSTAADDASIEKPKDRKEIMSLLLADDE